MNELVFKSQKGNSVTTSLLVAEKFEKEHKNVLRDINNLISSNLSLSKMFYKSEYCDSSNRSQPYYIMNRDGFSLLVMGFTGEKALQFKIEFIEAFNKLESAIKQIPNFNNPVEAARAWADEYEAKQIAENKVKELEPKAEVFDNIANADGLSTMNEVAKAIGIGRNTMMAKLRELSVLMYNNTPFQKYIKAGYFEVKIKTIFKGDKSENKSTTYVTGKGITYLSKIFKK